MRRAIILSMLSVVLLFCVVTLSAPPEGLKVGSKKFTESVILGEVVTQLCRVDGIEAHHLAELGGTRILWSALLSGEIDIYPEYTGTISQEILAGEGIQGRQAIAEALAKRGILMTEPLGFNNSYAIGMKKARAAALGLRTVSDLRAHPELKIRFTSEFMDRGDGWPSLRERYRLPHAARGLDHDVAYKGLASDAFDVMDLYSTDAEIDYYDLQVLEDDLGHFPRYDAVILYRDDLVRRHPEVVDRLRSLSGAISESRMIAMNRRAKIDRVQEAIVAADFLSDLLDRKVTAAASTRAGRIGATTREHLLLVSISMLAAILVAVPLGIWAASSPRLAPGLLGTVGVIQTIPALALLVLLMQLLASVEVKSLEEPPAILALFLYSLLPIVRNTYTGLRGIPLEIRESAAALGLPGRARLWRIELPLASGMILAGIKTAAVINVGFATLGALIGAGGYGAPILTGIRLDDPSLILEGAVPAAVLALLVQGLFDGAERVCVPRGLRLRPEGN